MLMKLWWWCEKGGRGGWGEGGRGEEGHQMAPAMDFPQVPLVDDYTLVCQNDDDQRRYVFMSLSAHSINLISPDRTAETQELSLNW